MVSYVASDAIAAAVVAAAVIPTAVFDAIVVVIPDAGCAASVHAVASTTADFFNIDTAASFTNLGIAVYLLMMMLLQPECILC